MHTAPPTPTILFPVIFFVSLFLQIEQSTKALVQLLAQATPTPQGPWKHNISLAMFLTPKPKDSSTILFL